jgi:hypothetical protein
VYGLYLRLSFAPNAYKTSIHDCAEDIPLEYVAKSFMELIKQRATACGE